MGNLLGNLLEYSMVFKEMESQSKLFIWNQISIAAHSDHPSLSLSLSLSQKLLLSKALIELVLLKDSLASNRAQNQDLNGVCLSVDFTCYHG
jgi:hypothetical protein